MQKLLFSIIILFSVQVFSQHDMVWLNHPVYQFLKEMKVKNLITTIHDDTPNLSRLDVLRFLTILDSNKEKLSTVEKGRLSRYLNEFSDDLSEEKSQFLFTRKSFLENLSGIFSEKTKYIYAVQDTMFNVYFEGIGNLQYGHRFNPGVNNAAIYDVGFRIRGTAFEKMGYQLFVAKGLATGNYDFAQVVDPALNYNFKYVEKLEKTPNYDFTTGYLRFYDEPVQNMSISVQIGREKTKVGYGYTNSLILSGDHADLDFVKFVFNYKSLRFTSMTGSTVGRFSFNRFENYTKYLAVNKLQLSFPGVLDASIAETIIYSERGIDLAYLTPLIFYKFSEMSLQDRDNGAIFFDLQTHFIPNLELQGTFYLDENILSNMAQLERFSNKSAYQIGAYWYNPVGVENLSLIFEYTKIRPFVYTHYNYKNTATSWDQPLGHQIGPNSDMIYFGSRYHISPKFQLVLDYSYIRKGKNIYDLAGNLVFNAGGDIFEPHLDGIDPDMAPFLAGIVHKMHDISVGFRSEIARDFYIDLFYKYRSDLNTSTNSVDNTGFIYFKFHFDY
ncbi:MAG: hypothetical protein IAE91_03870 [Ignavibacteriaceae bacterium]|nr:hypothetical protein [Ignavibacteriaceae bacterium]